MEFFEDGANKLDDGKKKPKKSKKAEQEVRKCPECYAVHRPLPECPNCGFVYPRKRIVHAPGELIELAGPDSTLAERNDLYAQLLWIARDRGYNPGWAAHKYRERTHVWPSRIMPEPQPPTVAVLNWVRSRAIAYAKSQKTA